VWHGRPWFEGIDLRGHTSHVEFLRAGLSPPLSLQAIPAFAASLIAQCLASNPSDRPSSAELLQRIRAPAAGAAARRADSLAEGDPVPFNPLPDGYTPRVSAAAAFAALMAGNPPARVQELVDAIQIKTREALRDVGTTRAQSEDEVFAIVAYTSDVRCIGLSSECNVWKRLNTILRRRDLKGFPPFADYYWYLTQGLSKVPFEPPTVVWRGLNDITLEQLGPRYTAGKLVCFLSFTSTSALKDDMTDFSTTAPGADSVYDRVIKIKTAALGAHHLETAATLHEKAIALVQMDGSANLAAAVALYDRVIKINTAALGAHHPSTAATLHEKAIALARMGGSANLAAAVALYDRVIDIKTAALGADHPSTAATLHEKAIKVVLPKGCVAERLCCRKVVLPKGCVAERLCCRKVVLPKGCVAERLCCRKVVLPKGCVAERLCCRKVVLPKGCVAERLCCRKVVLRSPSLTLRLAHTPSPPTRHTSGSTFPRARAGRP
jgi:hypothetical protein